MRLLARGGSAFRPGRSAVYSLAWGAGIALGLGMGAAFTAGSSAGAPGIASLDIGADLVGVPVAVGSAVAILHFAVTLSLAAIRGRRAVEEGPQSQQ